MNQITDKQRDNLEMALVMWTAVDPKTIWPGLGGFFCGTHACFGGHVATWQYFIRQGVTTVKDEDTRFDHGFLDGEPVMRTPEGLIDGHSLSECLFGDPYMFAMRAAQDGEETGLPHHDAIVHRLEKRIEELTS